MCSQHDSFQIFSLYIEIFRLHDLNQRYVTSVLSCIQLCRPYIRQRKEIGENDRQSCLRQRSLKQKEVGKVQCGLAIDDTVE